MCLSYNLCKASEKLFPGVQRGYTSNRMRGSGGVQYWGHAGVVWAPAWAMSGGERTCRMIFNRFFCRRRRTRWKFIHVPNWCVLPARQPALQNEKNEPNVVY
jgi:hypothetical protein